jgi:hypothetical protein
MIVTDPTSGKHLVFLMIFAYAPTCNAFETLKSDFEDALAIAMNRGTAGDVIAI